MTFNCSNRVLWESYKGKEFIFFDYSDLNDREVFDVLLYAKKQMNKVVDRKIRMLTDLRNMQINYNTHQTVLQITAEDMHKIEKAAFINNVEFNQVFINDFIVQNGLQNMTFEDKESAIEFLMNDD